MKFIINIDKKSKESVYMQIARQIREAVQNGVLKPGDKLPTERELSKSLNLARGTVNKAYEELKKSGVIKVLQGSGSFVSKKEEYNYADRRKIAAGYIRELLLKLSELDFTPAEIRAMTDIALSRIENRVIKVNIALIECNPESLAAFCEQFESFPNVAVKLFMLDDVTRYSNPQDVFEDYDIIITTVTHFELVAGMLHGLRDRIFKVAVSPTQETIIKIAKAPKDSNIGVIVRSENFRRLVINRLLSMNIDAEKIKTAFEDDVDEVEKILMHSDVLIIPHFLLVNNRTLEDRLSHFRSRGKEVIDFQYHMEEGSLIYIEEHVKRLLNDTKRNGQEGLI